MKIKDTQWFTRIIQTKSTALLCAGIASFAQAAAGATIGLHFLTAQNVGGTNGNALATTDVAGAGIYAQANWNNEAGAQGTNVTGLVDSSGAVASGVTVSWTSPNTWSQNGNSTASYATPDQNLMNPYLDNGGSANVAISNPYNMFSTTTPANNNRNWPLVYLTGLQAWLATQGATAYDLVIYSDGDATSARTGEYWAAAASGDSSAITLGADLISHIFVCDRNNFITTNIYTQVPVFIQSGLIAEFGNFFGNYTVLTGLTNDTVLLRTQRFNSRAPINNVQIIPRASVTPPTIAPILDSKVYAGGTARYVGTVAGVLPLAYQWQKNGVNLSDGGNIAGSSTATLTVSTVSGGDVASYSLVASNASGVVTSAPAALAIVAPVGNSYPEKISTNIAYSYWRFNETGDPSTNFTVAYDFVGGRNGTYANAALNGFNGVAGPQPPAFPGLENGNFALQTANSSIRTWVTAPPLNLNTNSATFCAFIYPTAAAEPGFCALIASRNGSDVASFGYGGALNTLGYTWNSNNAATFNFNSQLVVPSNTWSFVALTITPTNATLYVYNTNALLSATNTITHSNEGWSGLTFIGCDAQNSANTPQGRSFVGVIDELAVFNHALPPIEVYNLYKKALNQGAFPPLISQDPQSLALMAGRTAQFSVKASGDPFLALSYQWRTNGINVPNGAEFSGATTPTLTVANVTTADAMTYDVVVNNLAGSAVSLPATLSVIASNSNPVPYEGTLRALNPTHYWRFNEANGSPYAYDYWGGNIATNINFSSVSGPEPPDFAGFEANNSGGAYDGFTTYADTQISPMNNLAQFSIVGWFNEPGFQTTRIGLFGQNDATEFGFHGTNNSGVSVVGIWTPNGGAAYLGQDTNVAAGVWYMAAGVGDGTNISLYLFSTNGGGGVQVAQSVTAAATTNYGNSPYPFRIGGGGVLDPVSNYFTGDIDEVATFNRALSQSELSSLYAAGLGVSAIAPQITSEPQAAATLYAGRNYTLSVGVVGSTPLHYQWRTNSVPISDLGNVSGSGTATLTITNLNAGNSGNYDVVITNSAGSVTSTIASLAIITPTPGGYLAQALALNPFAYYGLNETDDPSTGTAITHDYVGGHNGLYGPAASNAFDAIFGPEPPAFPGFDASNGALWIGGGVTNAYATAPVGSLSTNTVTFTAWLYPVGTQLAWSGLLVNRNGGVAGGFNYNDQQMLGYTWNNNNQNTWGFVSGLVIPTNQWSFVAVAISPTNAILYLISPNGGIQTATNAIAHTSDAFGNNWQLGRDNLSNLNDGTRNFNGIIDEASLFLRTLSRNEILQLYNAGGVPFFNLSIQDIGGKVILTWPSGTLQQADVVTGPYSDMPSISSPYTNSPTAAQKFYRVRVR